MIDFCNITYLKSGNILQVKAYQALAQNKILERLANYHPILVGTIPININISGSDLDIICEVSDHESFALKIKAEFGNQHGFKIYKNLEQEATIANFFIDDFEIEIFGQNKPTLQQNAYRHMIIEYKILKEKDEDFRQQIIHLKMQGNKTEPAFAILLELKGNPYLALLDYV